MNDWYDQDCGEARVQKNVARIKWINRTHEQDRQEYKIKGNRANAIYRGKKEKLDE